MLCLKGLRLIAKSQCRGRKPENGSELERFGATRAPLPSRASLPEDALSCRGTNLIRGFVTDRPWLENEKNISQHLPARPIFKPQKDKVLILLGQNPDGVLHFFYPVRKLTY